MKPKLKPAGKIGKAVASAIPLPVKEAAAAVTSHPWWAHTRDAVMTLGVSGLYIGSKYGQPWDKTDTAALLGIVGGMYTLAYSTPASALKNQTPSQAAQSKDSTS